MDRRKVTLAGLLATLGLAANTATPIFAQTSDPHNRMNIWVGRWRETVELKETAYSHAATIPSQVTCGWSSNQGFMVCEYLHDTTDALSIFRYDDKDKTYKHVGIVKDGKTREEIPVVVEGNLWRYTYQETTKSGAKLDLRDSYEFVTPEKRITRIEVSADGGQHWNLVAEEVGTKVS